MQSLYLTLQQFSQQSLSACRKKYSLYKIKTKTKKHLFIKIKKKKKNNNYF